jgi:UDP-arabinose 4-epimerase
MKSLVTGGAGYIGSHACNVLASRVRQSFEGQSLGGEMGPLELGDIADSTRLRVVLEQYRPAALMHFAAHAYVGESVEYPLLYYRNNVAGSASNAPRLSNHTCCFLINMCDIWGAGNDPHFRGPSTASN